ncbi:MAG: hypothetical protein ACM3S0_05410 [Acidobacteriota bacterium]
MRLTRDVQDCPLEVIVPFDSTVDGIAELEREFPQVLFVNMGDVGGVEPGASIAPHSLLDLRTTIGLSKAKGEVLALLEDYGVPDADWCRQLLQAHQLYPHGVIGGAVEHSGKGLLNWAVYLLDFGRYQLPLREGPSNYLTDVNVSYKRSALESVREIWSKRYNEVQVHWALGAKGVVLWQRPQAVVREDRGDLSFREILAERFAWGRVFGYMRTQQVSSARRFVYILAMPSIPLVVIARIVFKVIRSGRNLKWLLWSFPLIAVFSIFWCLGELAGYLTGGESSIRDSVDRQGGYSVERATQSRRHIIPPTD